MDSSRPATQQLLSIQILRALAALGVVWQHIQYDFRVKFGVADFPPTVSIVNGGVDVFFVISGFIMVYSSSSLFQRGGAWREFITRRVIRVVPLYWLTSLVALVYILIRQRQSDIFPPDIFHKWVVSSFLFIPYPRTNGEVAPLNGVGWTLNYEMFFYLFFAAVIWLQRQAAVVVLSLLFVIVVLAAHLFGPLANPFAFWGSSLILEFVFGMLVALLFQSGIKLPPWLAWALVFFGIGASLLIGYFQFNLDLYAVDQRVIEWGLPAAIVMAGLTLRRRPTSTHRADVVARTLSFLGDASYSLYLVHPFTITSPRLINFGLHADGLTPPQDPWFYVFFQFFFAIVIGVLVHVAVEKPMTNVLRKWSRRKRPATIKE